MQAFIGSKQFRVTVLKRHSSESQFPESVKVLHVDYDSVQDLTAALADQDAVVSALTTSAMDTQLLLIEAAVKAGVRRFIPSEFSANIGNPKAAALPVYHSKVKVHDVLRQTAEENQNFTYSLIRNGPFLDWSLAFGFFLNMKGGETPLYDGGDRPFSTTTLSTVGKAVVEVLCHFEDTKNRVVFVQDLVTTQKEILKIAQGVKPERTWIPKGVSTAEMEARAHKNYANGLFDLVSSVGFFCRSVFAEGYGGEFQEVDNELLGIQQKTSIDLEALIREALKSDQ